MFQEQLGTGWDTKIPRSQGDYITKVSEVKQGRVTKKSLEFNKTEFRILGAVSRPGEFFLSPLFQGYSRFAPETSRNRYGWNQGTNEDCTQSDPHPEARVSQSQSTQDSGPDNPYERKAWFSDSSNYILTF